MKKKLIYIAGLILAGALPLLGYMQFAGIEGVAFKFDIAYDGNMDALWAALDTFSDGTVVIITFRADGMEIPHTEKMQLMGGSDAAFDVGDQLPLHKTDGIWIEMTRYLK